MDLRCDEGWILDKENWIKEGATKMTENIINTDITEKSSL